MEEHPHCNATAYSTVDRLLSNSTSSLNNSRWTSRLLTSIINTISEQDKIERTLHQLVHHSAEVSHPEHAAHFRLYALRLEQQRIPLPIYFQGDEEE